MRHRSLRCYDGQVVDCWVIRYFLCFALVQWRVRKFVEHPGDGTAYSTTKVAWRPRWRLL